MLESLKKDSAVMMLGAVQHADASLWGPNVNEFNPRRFVKRDLKKGEAKLNPGAFRASGSGQTLCPGRFFATTEITSSLAMFVMRFDFVPEGGKWVIPETAGNRVASSIHPPEEDVRVRITTRKECVGDEWALLLGI
ncbi:hypothetical protein MMC28_005229 [Mycoblastus sanguinarius]|nr:hypothetical protein [Mycoblastus sanguinarius]